MRDDRRRDLARNRHAWVRAILRSDLTSSTKVVALSLNAIWLDAASGTCRVGKETIANAVHLSVKTVDAAIRTLEKEVWIWVKRRHRKGGRNHANEYELNLSADKIGEGAPYKTTSKPGNGNPEKSQRRDLGRGQFDAREGRNSRPPEPCHESEERADATACRQVGALLAITSPEAERWREWLEEQGFPSLEEMGLQCERAKVAHVITPTERVPADHDLAGVAASRRWFNLQLKAIDRRPIDFAVLARSSR